MFAAYNAGPGRLNNHLKTRAALPLETQNYVKGIVKIVQADAPRVKTAKAKRRNTKTKYASSSSARA
jgi:soluble lytic murein transglycosylase-like protein